MEQQSKKTNKKQSKKTNNDLLKCERQTFELKRNEEGKVQAIISKLLIQQKQKPEIGFLPRSHLFDQLNSFMPILKQSNQQLMTKEIKPEQRIDAKLEEVQDSSSSQSEDEGLQKMQDENKMQEEKPSTQVLQSCDQFQFNILTYPYLGKDSKKEVVDGKVEQLSKNMNKIVEIVRNNQEVHQMQKMD